MRVAATELLLIRHGETAWNAEGRIQGQLDIPLSSTGMWQAGRLAERFAAEAAAGGDGHGAPVAAIYSSGLARAWFTAQPVATKLGLEVRAEPRFVERSFGVFEGHTLEEVARKWPEDFARWRARDQAATDTVGVLGLLCSSIGVAHAYQKWKMASAAKTA